MWQKHRWRIGLACLSPGLVCFDSRPRQLHRKIFGDARRGIRFDLDQIQMTQIPCLHDLGACRIEQIAQLRRGVTIMHQTRHNRQLFAALVRRSRRHLRFHIP